MDWRLEKENEEEEKREEETSALLSSSFAKDAKPAPPGTIQNERRGPGGGWDDETIDPSGHCDRNNLHDEEEKGKTSFSSSFFDTATTATEGRWRRQRPEGRGGRATDARTSVAKDDAAMEEGVLRPMCTPAWSWRRRSGPRHEGHDAVAWPSDVASADDATKAPDIKKMAAEDVTAGTYLHLLSLPTSSSSSTSRNNYHGNM